MYDNQGKNLPCCDILDGNVSGAQLPEHSSVVEQLAYIQRVGGSVPSVPIGVKPPKAILSPKEYNFSKTSCRNTGRFCVPIFVQRAQHQP
nr:MAG: hypothetical protein [Bacteriophage sp.]